MKAHIADYYITVGYWSSDMADLPVSISLLAMMLTTIGQDKNNLSTSSCWYTASLKETEPTPRQVTKLPYPKRTNRTKQ